MSITLYPNVYREKWSMQKKQKLDLSYFSSKHILRVLAKTQYGGSNVQLQSMFGAYSKLPIIRPPLGLFKSGL